MEKLKEMVIKLATSQKNQPLTSSEIDLLHQHLHREFPHGIRTPNHPTYAHMIEKAITGLNEEGGSSEAMISTYIKEHFKDLPWAHKSILNHHLNKLCDHGNLVFNVSKRYSFPLFNEVQEFKLVNETRTRQRSDIFLEENELIEIDEQSFGPSEIKLLQDNPEQKEQEACEQREPKMIGWTINEALQDETRTNVLVMERIDGAIVCALPAVLPESIKPKEYNNRKKKEAMKHTHKVLVCGQPAKQPDTIEAKQRNTRKKKLKRKSTDFVSSENENQERALFVSCQEESKIIHSEANKWPSWVDSLLQTCFFEECAVHPNTNTSICIFYCVNCINGSLCAHCVANSHKDHQVIRIRRTVYDAAVNAATLQTYLDISGIQTHMLGDKEIVSIKRTVQTRFRNTNSLVPCACYSRRIPRPLRFCSLSCKHQHQHQMDGGAPLMITEG